MSNINYIQIYGERHTGTKFLGKILNKSSDVNKDCPKLIDLKYSPFGWKHGFPLLERIKNRSDILIICIFRNPYDWTKAMYELYHHPHPSLVNKEFEEFIKTTWRTLSDKDFNTGKKLNGFKEIPHDKNPISGENFKNVLELRNYKNSYLLDLKKYIKNVIYINYEELINNPSLVIQKIKENRFNIKIINENSGIKSEFKKPKKLSQEAFYFINDNINWKIEEKLGYKKIEKHQNFQNIKSIKEYLA